MRDKNELTCLKLNFWREMPETTFSYRLKQAMSESDLKQVDLVRMASEQGTEAR